jgi:hypothetical protein
VDLVVDLGDVVEAFLNLLADHLELFRAEGAAVFLSKVLFVRPVAVIACRRVA